MPATNEQAFGRRSVLLTKRAMMSLLLATSLAVVVPAMPARAVDATADFSGVWEITGPPGFGRGSAEPNLTPHYAELRDRYQERQRRGEIQDTNGANCVPPGMPGFMTLPYPMEFLFTAGKVTIIQEAFSQWRQIFVDGRPHPADPDPTFNGHSVGHWEGTTLVVDSVGFTPETRLGNSGIQHSDKMRIVETMRLSDPDNLHIEMTTHDPVALQAPWAVNVQYRRRAEWTLAEYVCQQNNRNSTTEDGRADVDLRHEIAE